MTPSRLSICALAIGVVVATCDITDAYADGEVATPPLLTRHESLVKAWSSDAAALDVTRPLDVFRYVFARLPQHVRVYPSENYYYWQLDVDGRRLKGNIRLAVNERDHGRIGFAYSEPRLPHGIQLPDPERVSFRMQLGAADGVAVKRIGRSSYEVAHRGHDVRFQLENLSQHPTPTHRMREGEEFVGRTFDESGLPFLLMFQTRARYFFWVLDDEDAAERVREWFVPLQQHVLIGRRTGFVFRLDPVAGGRKVLIAVNGASVRENDYCDGPFDQLPDNHVATTRLRERMILENPRLAGKIDRFGYYLDDDPPLRVALVRYATYRDRDHLRQLLAQGAAAVDWLEYFARQPR